MFDDSFDYYKDMYKDDGKNLWREAKISVGYLSVLNTLEVKLLIVSGACRQSADYLSFYALGYSHSENKQVFLPHDLTPYFYGALGGILTLGPMYDLWFSGAAYLMVISLTSAMVCF